MTDYEWSVMICKIDGNAYRRWLTRFTKLTPEEIEQRVGATGPERKQSGLMKEPQ